METGNTTEQSGDDYQKTINKRVGRTRSNRTIYDRLKNHVSVFGKNEKTKEILDGVLSTFPSRVAFSILLFCQYRSQQYNHIVCTSAIRSRNAKLFSQMDEIIKRKEEMVSAILMG